MSDLIDRKMAIDVACKVCEVPNIYKCKGRNTAFKWCKEISKLLDLPTENQKKGEWVKQDGIIHCSSCKTRWSEYFSIEISTFNYCPNCGTRMR